MNGNSRLLVTGGAGFIGANFVHHWLARYPRSRIVVLDALTYAGNRASLAALDGRESFRFEHGDIRETERVARLLRDERLDTLVHFAAETHVDRSIALADPFIDTNVVGTCSLLKAAKDAWLDGGRVPDHRFHHVSTDEVYGSLSAAARPFTEESPYDPSSPYSASKAAADHFVRAWMRTYGLQVTLSNCSNNYGPWHYPEKLVPLIIVNTLLGRTLPIYGDGRQIRDWLYVEDHCRAIDLILERGVAGHTYNVGGNCEMGNLDLVRALCAIIDERMRRDATRRAAWPDSPAARGERSDSLLRFVADRPGHDRRYALDSEKLQALPGSAARTPLADGLQRTVDWFLANRSWWQPLLDDERYETWLTTAYGK